MAGGLPGNPETQKTEEREVVENIARNISALAKSVSALLSGPLKRRTILILLAHSSGMSQQTVEKVLTALSDMEKDWLK